MPDFSFSEQAQLLIDDLELNEQEVKEWYAKEVSMIGGAHIHHFLIYRATKNAKKTI